MIDQVITSRRRDRPSAPIGQFESLTTCEVYEQAVRKLKIDIETGTITRRRHRNMRKSDLCRVGESAISVCDKGNPVVNVKINGQKRRLNPAKLVWMRAYGEYSETRLASANGDKEDIRVANLLPRGRGGKIVSRLDNLITIDSKGRHCVYSTLLKKITSRHETLKEAMQAAGYNYTHGENADG